MQLCQALSFQTQHEMARLFESVIIGMRRLEKCFLYFQSLKSPSKFQYLFNMVGKGAPRIQWQQISDFLKFHKVEINREESVGLLLIMGGDVDGITLDEFVLYLSSRDEIENTYEEVHKHQQEVKNEIEMTFVKTLEEELLLEKNADISRKSIQSRWDYQENAVFRTISRGKEDSTIDYKKIKLFFTRLRYPINDEELYHLMKRFGSDGIITFETFQRVVLPLSDRVSNAIDEWSGIKKKMQQSQGLQTLKQSMTLSIKSDSRNNKYFDRLKKKYLQSTYSQHLNDMNKNKTRAQSSHNQISQSQVKERSKSTQKSCDYDFITRSTIFHKKVNLQDMFDEIRVSQDIYKTPDKPKTIIKQPKLSEPKQQYNSSQESNTRQNNQVDQQKIKMAKSQLHSTLATNVTQKQTPIKSQQNGQNHKEETQQQRSQKQIPNQTVNNKEQRTTKQLNQLTFPLFNLSKVIVNEIEETIQLFKTIPESLLLQLQNIKENDDWAQEWKIVNINTFHIKSKEFMKALNQYSNLENKTYEEIYTYKIDKQYLQTVQNLFQLLSKSKQNINQVNNINFYYLQAKLTFFSTKQCSFIQLFEELDMNQKGYLDERDIENLLSNASIIIGNQSLLKILFKSLSQDGTNQIKFHTFLKELSP